MSSEFRHFTIHCLVQVALLCTKATHLERCNVIAGTNPIPILAQNKDMDRSIVLTFSSSFVLNALACAAGFAHTGYSEPIKYNLSVAGSIAKQVYVAESLAPPTSLHTITSAYRQLWSKATDRSYWSQLLTNGDWKKLAIYAVEAYGIFTIGEMIGRRSLVGYKIDSPNHSHH